MNQTPNVRRGKLSDLDRLTGRTPSPPISDPEKFGRRVAAEIFEKYVKSRDQVTPNEKSDSGD